MDLSLRSGCSHDRLRRCRRGQAREQRAGDYGQRCLRSRQFTLPCFCTEIFLNRLNRKSLWVIACMIVCLRIRAIVSNYSSGFIEE